ncbi:MAG: peptidylprolyl isomerase [Candidatus Sericytochromatia bacterium]|nr:peptidylprolyl isomerase [Candidatus Sericytochromatia bacterium]
MPSYCPPVVTLRGLLAAALVCATTLTLGNSPASARTVAADATPRAATLQEVEKAAGHKVVKGTTVVLQTSKGKIEIVMFPKEAPKTVANFLKLVKSGFYNNTTFHRVIPGFVSQGGDPLSKTLKPGDGRIGTGDPGYKIEDEHGNGLKHIPGAVAMAHSAMPNSAGCQFYITHAPITHLDGGYTIFGHVTKGFELAASMAHCEGCATPERIIKASVR